MPMQEIDALTKRLVQQLSPVRVYLFGSYADGSFGADSDFDFYIVVADDAENMADLTAKAYRAIRDVKQRPVDIIVGSRSRFEARSAFPSVENEVVRKGVLLYAS